MKSRNFVRNAMIKLNTGSTKVHEKSNKSKRRLKKVALLKEFYNDSRLYNSG